MSDARNGGYGGALSYKDAALAALSDDLRLQGAKDEMPSEADFEKLPGMKNANKHSTDELGAILDRTWRVCSQCSP